MWSRLSNSRRGQRRHGREVAMPGPRKSGTESCDIRHVGRLDRVKENSDAAEVIISDEEMGPGFEVTGERLRPLSQAVRRNHSTPE